MLENKSRFRAPPGVFRFRIYLNSAFRSGVDTHPGAQGGLGGGGGPNIRLKWLNIYCCAVTQSRHGETQNNYKTQMRWTQSDAKWPQRHANPLQQLRRQGDGNDSRDAAWRQRRGQIITQLRMLNRPLSWTVLHSIIFFSVCINLQIIYFDEQQQFPGAQSVIKKQSLYNNVQYLLEKWNNSLILKVADSFSVNRQFDEWLQLWMWTELE